MSLFKRLGRAATLFGQEMNKGVWIASVRQLASSIDPRSFDWHQQAPESITNAVYGKLWKEIGQPSMRFPRERHVQTQKMCACWIIYFFNTYHDAVERGEAIDLEHLIVATSDRVNMDSALRI